MSRMPRPGIAVLASACAALVSAGCGGSITTPTPATPAVQNSQLVFIDVSPPSGSTIRVVTGGQPGLAIPRGSGLLSVTVRVTVADSAPRAQLYLFLLTGDRSGATYCAQNLPDAPTWPPEPRGQGVPYTITGFQVYRLPCDVTAIRAILHTRDGLNQLDVPAPEYRLVDVTVPADLKLR